MQYLVSLIQNFCNLKFILKSFFIYFTETVHFMKIQIEIYHNLQFCFLSENFESHTAGILENYSPRQPVNKEHIIVFVPLTELKYKFTCVSKTTSLQRPLLGFPRVLFEDRFDYIQMWFFPIITVVRAKQEYILSKRSLTNSSLQLLNNLHSQYTCRAVILEDSDPNEIQNFTQI